MQISRNGDKSSNSFSPFLKLAPSLWRRICYDCANGREVVDKRHWITEEDVMDIITIAESTPGVIAVKFGPPLSAIKRPDSGALFFATLG